MANYFKGQVNFGKNTELGEILVKVEYDEAADQTYIEWKVVVSSGVYCMESEEVEGTEDEASDEFSDSKEWQPITQAEWDSHICNKRMIRDGEGMLAEA